jgi:hypothetical protein
MTENQIENWTMKVCLKESMPTKSKRPPLEAKARKERQEMENELVLEGIHPNKKQKAIAKSQCKSGEMDNRLVV